MPASLYSRPVVAHPSRAGVWRVLFGGTSRNHRMVRAEGTLAQLADALPLVRKRWQRDTRRDARSKGLASVPAPTLP